MKQVLQYLWIEKYKCIEKQGFNFTRSAEIKFDYDTGKLSIEKNKNYCENFFGDNIELSCIVGQNGVGKTTLLRAIKEIFSLDYGTPEYNCVAIFYDGSKYEGWYKLNDCKIDCDETQLELHPLKGKKLLNGQLVTEYKKADYLYYSEQFVQNLYSMPYGEDELSTSHLLFDEGYGETGDHISRFFLKEFEKQMNLIIDYGEKLEKFKIKYPPFVKATLIRDRRIFEDFIKQYDSLGFTATLNDIYKNLFPEIHLTAYKNIDRFKDKLAEAIFLNIVYVFRHTANGLTDNQFKSLLSIMQKYNNLKIGWEFLRAFLKDKCFESKQIEILYLKEYISFMDYIDKIQVSPNKNALSGFVFDNSFIIPTIKDYNNDQVDFINDIKEFFEKYFLTAEFNSYINFSWGLSSGETSLLNIFSRLYSSKCRKESKNEAAVFLLDEIDVTLHPEWQRTIINELLKFIKYAFKDKYVQVIMTTHSPIMLSDIPKQNVLFLKKSDDGVEECDGCDTFASNIFQLFREGFFIGDTGIGVYAEQKLKEIVDHIHNSDIDDNELRKLIDSVGDTFLRNKLNEEYLIYHSHENDTEEKQSERIIVLENQLIKANVRLNETNIKHRDDLLELQKILNHNNEFDKYPERNNAERSEINPEEAQAIIKELNSYISALLAEKIENDKNKN